MARCLIDLGAALRRANQRIVCRRPLLRGRELAHACGALDLAERAATELRATGARPRRIFLTGAAALTASERRVAQLAATGHTNREIAQRLYITPKTVEKHLSSAYAKLEITSRAQLTPALQATTARTR